MSVHVQHGTTYTTIIFAQEDADGDTRRLILNYPAGGAKWTPQLSVDWAYPVGSEGPAGPEGPASDVSHIVRDRDNIFCDFHDSRLQEMGRQFIATRKGAEELHAAACVVAAHLIRGSVQ